MYFITFIAAINTRITPMDNFVRISSLDVNGVKRSKA